MNRMYWLLGVVVIALGLSGCFRAAPVGKTAAGPVNPGPPADPAQAGPQPPAGGVAQGGIDLKRVITKSDAANQLRNIAQFYIFYTQEHGQPPATQKDLMEYLKTEANKEYKSLDEGYFVIVPKAKTASGVIIAYEQNGDSSGNHFVATGDGAVNKMTTQELRAALGLR